MMPIRSSKVVLPPLTREVWSLLGLGASLACLIGVTIYELQTEIWVQDAGSQGPIAVLLTLWLFWHKLREPDVRAMLSEPRGNLGLGLIWLVPGLLLFTLARSQSIMLVVTLALIPMLVGVSIALLGTRVTRACWFCFFFILFVVPLPIAVVDALTQPLKLGVSWATEKLLYSAGYPIAREGVVLHLWPYKLLVADACAGLHSLFTLEALGLLYLNVVRHESALRNTLMAIFIIPVSFISNVLRVVVLALITFHVSDAAGQGFAHDFAGLALFVLALLLIISADGLARRISRTFRR